MIPSHNYKILAVLALAWGTALAQTERGGGLVQRTNDSRRQVTLKLEDHWRLRAPRNERFDASGLFWHKGRLLTINDRGPELFEIIRHADHTGELRPTEFFPQAALAQASPTHQGRFDSEGIAADDAGDLYICEESRRSVFRSRGASVELLPIDWSPARAFFKGGINASFEGIAWGGGKLYLANERDQPRIIVVDLPTLKVEQTFFVDAAGFALGGAHYTDLSFAGGRLFVLDRNHRCVLEVDPAARRVLAEHAYGPTELAEPFAYLTDFPTGTMEGLAVDAESFWLITDNNGRGRFQDRNDFRPTLFRFKREG